MIQKRKASLKTPPFARRIEQYAKTSAFVLKGKVIAPKAGKTGRPSVMTQDVVRKLEYAFAYDCTVEEACLYASISRNTYYEFLKQYPDFQDRIEALRGASILMARMTVLSEVERNADVALKYLERKRKSEFSTRAEMNHTGNVIDRHSVSPKTLELIQTAMGNFAKMRAKKLTANQ